MKRYWGQIAWPELPNIFYCELNGFLTHERISCTKAQRRSGQALSCSVPGSFAFSDKTCWEHAVYTLFHLHSFPLSLLLNQGIAESPQYYAPLRWPLLTWPLASPGLLGFLDCHWRSWVGHVWSYPAWTSYSPVFIQLERGTVWGSELGNIAYTDVWVTGNSERRTCSYRMNTIPSPLLAHSFYCRGALLETRIYLFTREPRWWKQKDISSLISLNFLLTGFCFKIGTDVTTHTTPNPSTSWENSRLSSGGPRGGIPSCSTMLPLAWCWLGRSNPLTSTSEKRRSVLHTPGRVSEVSPPSASKC